MNKRTSTFAAVVAMTGALIALHLGGANAAPPRQDEPTPTIQILPPRDEPPCHQFGTCLTPSPTPAPAHNVPMFEGGRVLFLPSVMR